MNLSEQIERANELLHPRATPHQGRLGREHPEEEDEYRFPFMRDIARITHSTAFRRMQGKMQVFCTGENDHQRNRLTHTLEGAHITQEFARMLRLNEDLARAQFLMHDMGHSPYGHSGEQELDACMKAEDPALGFDHNRQCHRLVTQLEHHRDRLLYPGLNLNRELLNGTFKHDTHHPVTGERIIQTPEFYLSDAVDGITYIAHDTDDALHADLFPLRDLLKVPLAQEAFERIQRKGTSIRGALISILGKDLIETSQSLLDAGDEQCIRLSDDMKARFDELHDFHKERIYRHPELAAKRKEGKRMMREVFEHYMRFQPSNVLQIQWETGCSLTQAAGDCIGLMTERYLHKKYQQIAKQDTSGTIAA